MSSTIPLVPVILCGGTGSRLWPLSRASYPKQYWALAGSDEATLLQQTQQRLAGLAGLAAPLLVCHEDHRFIVAEQLHQIGVKPAGILLEPLGRNTAPAIAVAALQAATGGRPGDDGAPPPQALRRPLPGPAYMFCFPILRAVMRWVLCWAAHSTRPALHRAACFASPSCAPS